MQIQHEQATFLDRKPSLLGRGIERLTHPLARKLAGLVSSALVNQAIQGIDRTSEIVGATQFTHNSEVLAEAREAAARVEKRCRTINGGTGVIAGFGGMITAGLDIPTTVAIALRNIRDTGRAYGYDGRGDAEQMFRLRLFELATVSDREHRRQRIAALNDAIEVDGSLKKVDPKTATPLMDQIVERASRAFALASVPARAGVMIPLVGSAIGAAVNASFQKDVSEAARYGFQARRLMDEKS